MLWSPSCPGCFTFQRPLTGIGAVASAVATTDLADNDGGTDGLFGAPIGGVDRQVPQEEKHGSEFSGEVPGEALGVVQPWRCVNQPTEPGDESAADGARPGSHEPQRANTDYRLPVMTVCIRSTPR